MSVLVYGSLDWTSDLEFHAMHLTFYYLNQCFLSVFSWHLSHLKCNYTIRHYRTILLGPHMLAESWLLAS